MENLVRDLYAQLVALLERCDVPLNHTADDVLLEQIIRRVSTYPAGSTHAAIMDTILPGFLTAWLPQRWLEYDTERIYGDYSYIALLDEFAARTDGEWHPEQVQATLEEVDPTDFSKSRDASLRFYYGPRMMLWPMRQTDDWVSPDFIEQLHYFARSYLSGDFVQVPPGGQVTAYIYLPRLAALHLAGFIDELEYQYQILPISPQPAKALGSISLQRWDIFEEIGGLGWLREGMGTNPWVMDTSPVPPGDLEASLAQKHTLVEGDTPLNWAALLADNPPLPPGPQDVALAAMPVAFNLYFGRQVNRAVYLMTNILVSADNAVTTVLVPFVGPPETYSTIELPLSGDLSDTFGAPCWRVTSTRKVLLKWNTELNDEQRKYAAYVFTHRTDTGTDLIDDAWLFAALVYFSRLSIEHKRPVLLRVAPTSLNDYALEQFWDHPLLR